MSKNLAPVGLKPGGGLGVRRPDCRPGRTTRKVLDAGLDELRITSYGELTMRNVAARAEVSPASAYRYFPSKNALVATLYLHLLQAAPVHVDVNEPANDRVTATMQGMALVGTDDPALLAACAAALVAEDPAVAELRVNIAEEVSKRIHAALGPGWPHSVASTLELMFSGALLRARFMSFDTFATQLSDAVDLIMGMPDASK